MLGFIIKINQGGKDKWGKDLVRKFPRGGKDQDGKGPGRKDLAPHFLKSKLS